MGEEKKFLAQKWKKNFFKTKNRFERGKTTAGNVAPAQ